MIEIIWNRNGFIVVRGDEASLAILEESITQFIELQQGGQLQPITQEDMPED